MEREDGGGTLEHAMHKAEDVVGGVVGRAGALMVNRGREFVENAAASDMYEIEAGRVATERAKSGEVRELARQMVEDHRQSSDRLKAALPPELRDAVPSSLDTRRRSMVEHLHSARSEDFDKMYVDQQVMAHKEAVTLMRHFSENGDDAVLRRHAEMALPMIQGHLEKFEALNV